MIFCINIINRIRYLMDYATKRRLEAPDALHNIIVRIFI
jgi:hypothetical protein